MKTQSNHRHSLESGNALWIILIMIVLLASLTLIVTRSSDSTEESGARERDRITATKLMNYTKSIEQAVQRMQMRGISENDICFHDSDWGHTDYNGASCSTAENLVFGTEGGGLSVISFDDVSSWDIFGSHGVQDLETSANELIIQAQVDKKLCKELNRILGISNPSGDAPVDDADAAEPFQGSFADPAASTDNVIGDDAAGFAGQKSGCRKDDAGDYYFYHVLIAR